jgi:hypothetical protein
MSPAIAAARNTGPPIAGGNASIESSGAFIAAVFDEVGAGGGVEGIGRGGSEPVGSGEFGAGDCDGDGVAGGSGAGVTVGAALCAPLGAAGGVALDGGVAVGCAAGAAVAAGSEFCDGFPPALPPGAAFGATFDGALATGATGDGSALPKGCGDPLCGSAAFGFFCGGAVGSAGLCHGADASPAGRLS